MEFKHHNCPSKKNDTEHHDDSGYESVEMPPEEAGTFFQVFKEFNTQLQSNYFQLGIIRQHLILTYFIFIHKLACPRTLLTLYFYFR